MIATTPSGTRTFSMAKPFGRVQPAVTSPTGSGRAATWRRPSAIASTRARDSRRRSTTVGVVPAASARATSAALAASTSLVWETRTSAAASSAASFAADGAGARIRDAALARRPSSGNDAGTEVTPTTLPAVSHSIVVHLGEDGVGFVGGLALADQPVPEELVQLLRGGLDIGAEAGLDGEGDLDQL